MALRAARKETMKSLLLLLAMLSVGAWGQTPVEPPPLLCKEIWDIAVPIQRPCTTSDLTSDNCTTFAIGIDGGLTMSSWRIDGDKLPGPTICTEVDFATTAKAIKARLGKEYFITGAHFIYPGPRYGCVWYWTKEGHGEVCTTSSALPIPEGLR